MIGVIRLRVLGVLLTLALACPAAATADEIAPAQTLFRRENLVAWCIVPFDDEPRSPVDRAAMMKRLGIGQYAYDYRAEHIPQFDDEMRALRAQGIDLLRPLTSSVPLERVVAHVRTKVPFATEDRVLYHDMEATRAIVASGVLRTLVDLVHE